MNTEIICPTGWHVPDDAEWTILRDYLGGASVAGGKMKETDTLHWMPPNTGATNESGFTALPGGQRSENNCFYNLGHWSFWWSSTGVLSTNASCWYICGDFIILFSSDADSKQRGYSVRCLKD